MLAPSSLSSERLCTVALIENAQVGGDSSCDTRGLTLATLKTMQGRLAVENAYPQNSLPVRSDQEKASSPVELSDATTKSHDELARQARI